MLTPKTVLITGANRGIGLEMVRSFLNLPSPPKILLACCRDIDGAKELQELAKENANIHLVQLDVTNCKEINSAKDAVSELLKEDGLNILINNAGVFVKRGLAEVDKETMMTSYEINAVAPLMMTQAFLPLLKQAASLQPEAPMSCSRAAIINVSSGTGSISENTTSGMYPSRISKAALNMITANLSIDLRADGILCTAVHPGWVKTDMGGPSALISTETCLRGFMAVLEKLHGVEGTGKFYHGVSGDVIGW